MKRSRFESLATHLNTACQLGATVDQTLSCFIYRRGWVQSLPSSFCWFLSYARTWRPTVVLGVLLFIYGKSVFLLRSGLMCLLTLSTPNVIKRRERCSRWSAGGREQFEEELLRCSEDVTHFIKRGSRSPSISTTYVRKGAWATVSVQQYFSEEVDIIQSFMQRDPRQSQVNPARTTFGDNLIWYGFYHQALTMLRSTNLFSFVRTPFVKGIFVKSEGLTFIHALLTENTNFMLAMRFRKFAGKELIIVNVTRFFFIILWIVITPCKNDFE